MRFFALAALSAVATASLSDTLEPRGKGCVKGVHIIALGGQGTTQGDLGYLSTLVGNITRAIPHSNVAQIGYPKGALGPDAIAYAIPRVGQHIADYSARCPNSKIVIAAYSIGAAANMDALCGSPITGQGGIPKKYMPNLLANIVYGDLTYVPGLKYNEGTCNNNHGLVPRKYPGKCHPFGRKTQSYCDLNDINCCSGDSLAVHFSYPQKYDHIATNYVVKRYRRYRKNL